MNNSLIRDFSQNTVNVYVDYLIDDLDVMVRENSNLTVSTDVYYKLLFMVDSVNEKSINTAIEVGQEKISRYLDRMCYGNSYGDSRCHGMVGLNKTFVK